MEIKEVVIVRMSEVEKTIDPFWCWREDEDFYNFVVCDGKLIVSNAEVHITTLIIGMVGITPELEKFFSEKDPPPEMQPKTYRRRVIAAGRLSLRPWCGNEVEIWQWDSGGLGVVTPEREKETLTTVLKKVFEQEGAFE